jgi:hypothetical protein
MGQDVQLHTHPSWRDDPRDFSWLRKYKKENSYLAPNLDFMAKLSYAAQVSVLEEGINLLVKWLGKRPIAHRSGGYSINADTIAAVREAGLKIDSSMNSAHEHSKVVWSRNRIEQKDGVIEIPITVMRYVIRPSRMFNGGDLYSKILKTDLDVCSVRDLLSFVKIGTIKGLKIMNLMMHSYSFMKSDPRLRKFKPNFKKISRLKRFLEIAVRDPNISFMNCELFLSHYQKAPGKFNGPDLVPDIVSPKTILHLAYRKAKNKITLWRYKRLS